MTLLRNTSAVAVTHPNWPVVLDQVHEVVHLQKINTSKGSSAKSCLMSRRRMEDPPFEDVSRQGRLRRTVDTHFKVHGSFGKFH
ncbi:hypothetical protein TNCV_1170311 [Trichonephila clavipes]|nr:hypothetical protein TNCV_1170311 [Trichonephila clavipes]